MKEPDSVFCRTLNAIAFAIILCGLLAGQTKHALLIGIDTYEHPDRTLPKIKGDGQTRFDLLEWPNLEGAMNDVMAMQDLLTGPRFGFPKDPAHLHLLFEEDASRDGILKAMRQHLVEEPARGDIVVFYYAGHGSLRKNSKSIKRASHLDNTIVPSDADTGIFDVRDREIARIFNAALDKGVLLTAIFDSCHSATIARGILLGSTSKTRYLPYDPRDANEGPDMKDGKPVIAPEDREDNAALVFSATQPDQSAQEWPFEKERHGAFTMALIRALENLPADTPARDVYKRVKVVMEGMGLIDQQPVLDGTIARQQQPLFGRGSGATVLRVAVAHVSDSGTIVLDAGIASDLGPGSELVQMKERPDQASRIRIRSVDSLTRSSAEVVAASEGKISVGDLFEVVKWVPAQSSRLQVWTAPATLTQKELQAAANGFSTLRNLPGITWVDDPARQAPTHMIWWDGQQWRLSRSGSAAKASLGAKPDSGLVARQLKGSNVRLLVNLPPSRELRQQLGLDDTESSLHAATEPPAALYMLVGSVPGERMQYSWFFRSAFTQALTTPAAHAANPVCSTDSPYPARSDWVALPDGENIQTPALRLSTLASRLAKLHAWLELPTPPQSAASFPYHLVLKRRGDGAYVSGGPVREGENYDLVLRADRPVSGSIAPRWVYVLGIDCSGNGGLLFPSEGGENRFPQQYQTSQEIVLSPKRSVEISKPFGFDTYVLLTTAQQLPDPEALKFEGVVSRKRSDRSPLEDLLVSASGGARSPKAQVPINWSVQYLHVRSVPKQVIP